MERQPFPMWVGFVLILFASVGVVILFLRITESPPMKPSPLIVACDRLLEKHPQWLVKATIDEPKRQRCCYILASPQPGMDSWPIRQFLHGPARALNEQSSFAQENWKNVVYAHEVSWSRDQGDTGWHGPVLIKWPLLFCGDQDMLRQIDADLE